jgi:hypothetical protein
MRFDALERGSGGFNRPGRPAAPDRLSGTFPQAYVSVPLGNANDPLAGKTVPEKDRRSATDARATIAASNKELGHIKDVRVVRRGRATGDEHESRDTGVAFDDKCKPPLGLGPVERKVRIAEPPIVP